MEDPFTGLTWPISLEWRLPLTCFLVGVQSPAQVLTGRCGFFLEMYSLASVHRTHTSSLSK